jgi:hypothetical protein
VAVHAGARSGDRARSLRQLFFSPLSTSPSFYERVYLTTSRQYVGAINKPLCSVTRDIAPTSHRTAVYSRASQIPLAGILITKHKIERISEGRASPLSHRCELSG